MKKWLIILLIVAIMVVTFIILAIFSLDIFFNGSSPQKVGVKFGPQFDTILSLAKSNIPY